MMKIKGIFDTHCHLSDPLLKPQVIKVLEAAKSANISHICNVAYNQQTIKTVMFQSYKYFQLYPAIGIHPNCVSELEEEKISILELEKFILTGKVKAIGEIGLDYYRKQTTPLLQKKWFIEQLKLAKKYQLPVLVHVRDAWEDAFQLIRDSGITSGIIHCYTGNLDTALNFIKLGFYISFSGNITFKNAAAQQEIVKLLPIEKIVVETDAPYLMPEPFRGKNKEIPNTPANIVFTIKKIAELKKISVEEVIKITTNNACSLLKINF